MKNSELVVIPAPATGHVVPTIEFIKRLIHHDHRLSVTVLVINSPFFAIPPGYFDSNTTTRLRFIELTPLDPPPKETVFGIAGLNLFVESCKPQVKLTVSQLISSDDSASRDSVPLAGFILDTFTTTMIDIADKLGVPSYVYYTSSAASLGLILDFPAFDAQITTELLQDYDSAELTIPSFRNLVPLLALNPAALDEHDDGYALIRWYARRFKDVKGIIVNSFADLEPYAVGSFEDKAPRIYVVGPMIDRTGEVHADEAQRGSAIMQWLDNQPRSSVIFLCFGSMGTLGAAQVKEIAIGLERSGQRFLWSLRSFTNPEEVFPDGFLERTAGRGLICEWAPQMGVLGHEAIGCFVSHCGWNSVLESVWFGVPVLTWPLYAEQKLNSFELVRELGVAKELRGWSKGDGEVTRGDEVERCARSVLEGESELVLRERVKEMRDKCRKAVMEGGSSFISLGRLIEDLIIDS